MTFRHFGIFIAVCDTHGMTQAAEKLRMTQPSVSQAIKELEVHYGGLLFERLGRRLYLTPAGEKLLQYARHIVQLNEQAESAMRDFGAVLHLRIGASVTIGETVLIQLLCQLRAAMPEMVIFSEIHNTAELEQMVLSDALDLALVEGEVTSEYLIETAFMKDELIFVDAPQHGVHPVRNPAEVSQLPFFVREEGSGTRKLFEQEMRLKKIPFQLAGVYNNAEGIKKAVRAGLGVTVISQRSVEEELQRGDLLAFSVPGVAFARDFRMIYHRNKYISRGLKKFMDTCAEIGSHIPATRGMGN